MPDASRPKGVAPGPFSDGGIVGRDLHQVPRLAEPWTYNDMMRRYRGQLHKELGCALVKIGFFLSQFEMIEQESRWTVLVRGVVVCPCGGAEFFATYLNVVNYNWKIDTIDFGAAITGIVDQFKLHIKGEVERGELPPQWLERITA